MSVFALLGALLFGMIAVLTLLVTFGAPLGEFTMGGRHRIIPPRLRIATAVSFFIQLAGVFAILYVGGKINLPLPFSVARGFCLFMGIYLLINTVMNFLSTSKKEKLVMTPASFVTALCFLITALIH